MTQKIKTLGALLSLSGILFTTAPSFALDERIPMPTGSWVEVKSFLTEINQSYVPSPQIAFKYSEPQKVLSEKTAVRTLESVRDSLETNSGFEPWVFDHIQMKCDHPACTGQ